VQVANDSFSLIVSHAMFDLYSEHSQLLIITGIVYSACLLGAYPHFF